METQKEFVFKHYVMKVTARVKANNLVEASNMVSVGFLLFCINK